MTQQYVGQTRAPAHSQTGAASKLTSPASMCLLLSVCVLAVFWPTARHDFVDYDDGDYVTANSHVQSGLTWANVVWAFTTGHASNWHPLTWLSHMLDYQLFGQNAGAFHLVNVAFHITNTLLLFLVIRRMTGEHWSSGLVAAIFGLHPLHVESVAWISERKDVLSSFFFLLTLGAYVVYVRARPTATPRTQTLPPGESRTPRKSRIPERPLQDLRGSQATGNSSGGRPWLDYSLCLMLFSLGLMCKPMLVTVPFLLLLLDYWPLRRTPVEKHGSGKLWIRLLLEKLPFLVLAAGSSLVTFLVQHEGGAVSASLTLGQRLGNAMVSYVRYLYKTFWPANLSVLYPHPGSWPAWQVGASALFLLAIFLLVLLWVHKRPYLFVGWCWFIGMLIPVIGIVQVGIQSMADRYMYLPLVGLSIGMVWGLAELKSQTSKPRPWLVACALCAMLACALLTIRQVEFWRDSETLFRHAVEATRNNYLAYNNLGFYLSNHGRPLEAMENYRKSIEINSAYEDALNNMGFVLAGQKRHAEALPYYQAALRLKPRHAEVNNNLGNALSELGRIPEAIEHYQITLAQQPNHADAHNNLGIALAMQGKVDEAIPHFRDAIRFKPNYASAHSNLGNALASQQKWREAIVQYQECLRLNPEDPQAHNNLANVLTSQGQVAQAIEHYKTALRLNSINPEAHFNLGMALKQQGRMAEARQHFVEALRLKPDYIQAQRQLSGVGGGDGE